MKTKTLISIILLFAFIYCEKDFTPIEIKKPIEEVPPNHLIIDIKDSTIPDSIKTKYRTDAGVLTHRYIYETESIFKDSVWIPKKISDIFYFGLTSIYNDSSAPRDTVVELYPIHHSNELSVKRLILRVDTSYSWTHSFLYEGNLKSNKKVDSLSTLYGLRYGWSSPRSVTLFSNEVLNMNALAEQFLKIPGITRASSAMLVSYDRTIWASYDKFVINFSFYIGWEDCLSGCIYWRIWEFMVSNSGVSFVKSYGDPMSTWVEQ